MENPVQSGRPGLADAAVSKGGSGTEGAARGKRPAEEDHRQSGTGAGVQNGTIKKKRGLRAEAQGLVSVYALRSVPVRSLLKWADLPPSSFYYKRSGARKGIKPSTHTVTVHGEMIENKIVVMQVEHVLRQ